MKLGKGARIILVVVIASMVIVGLSNLIFLVPQQPSPQSPSTSQDTMQFVELTAPDGANLMGDYYISANPRGWVVYLHMMSGTRESYRPLASRLTRVGWGGIAIDLRGHGESQGGPDGYQSFSASEHRGSLKDIDLAIDFLVSQGVDRSSIVLVGASIGANLSLAYAAAHPEMSRIVALSPGTDYHGLKAGESIAGLLSSQKVLLVASQDDQNVVNNAEQVNQIASAAPADVVNSVIIVPVGGHGTDIVDNNPNVEDKVVEFIVQ